MSGSTVLASVSGRRDSPRLRGFHERHGRGEPLSETSTSSKSVTAGPVLEAKRALQVLGERRGQCSPQVQGHRASPAAAV